MTNPPRDASGAAASSWGYTNRQDIQPEVAVITILAGFAAASLAAAGMEDGMAQGSSRGYIELAGGPFVADTAGAKTGPREQSRRRRRRQRDSENVLVRKVNLPTRGVWYAWLKVSSEGPWPAVMTWDLDGVQPLMSERREILVQPYAKHAWVNHTRFPGFKIEVHVEEPGEHVLRFTRESGNVSVEKILLTLFHSATLKGDGLDMTDDPGRGRIEFPRGNLSACGARKDWRAPDPLITGTAYHVDATSGNDAAEGKTPATAWRTLDPVNARTFKPGDAILLKRGGTWMQGLAPKGSGVPGRPITIGAFGEGARPIVDGVNRPGVGLVDQSYWTIQDVAATSDPAYKESGIAVRASKDAPRPREIRILNCVAFDTGRHGISVGGHSGCDGVLIENCTSFCNLNDGIEVGGATARSGRNTVIRFCTTWSNPGMAGIWINGAENGLIEDCLAYNNACVNIWVWNATNVTIRRCEAFRGRPQRDAAGFDIDWGSQACTMEYCYAHHNEGDAFLLMGSGNIEYEGQTKRSMYNVVRYCVGEGGSPIDMGETFNHGLVYNNVGVAVGKGANAFKVFGWPNDANNDGGGWPENTLVTNNIFIGTEGASAMYVDDLGTGQGNDYDGNLFWRVRSKAPLIHWGGRSSGPGFWQGDRKTGTFPAKTYASLAAFRKATKLGGKSIEADPRLKGAGAGEYGRVPLDGYVPGKGSPVIGAGAKVVIPGEWRKERRAYLSETGAAAWGIPMEPADDPADYAGKLPGNTPSLGVREP
ncbi:MAG: right-handed parallel beta-helix repeat-containing protein [Candidatus Coatesbacteria bacterium]